MTGDELRVMAVENIRANGDVALKFQGEVWAELAAALDDRDRLEWLEQAPLDAEGLINLVGKWTWDGKRHPEGLRAAIDSARGKS